MYAYPDDAFDDADFEDDDDIQLPDVNVDDTLPPIEKLEKYCSVDFSLLRMALVRELTDTARDAGIVDARERVIPIAASFIDDPTSAVRQALAEVLPSLCKYFVLEYGEYSLFLHQLFPLALQLVIDTSSNVSDGAIQCMLEIGPLVREQHVDEHILDTLLVLASAEQSNENYRIVAIRILAELAESVLGVSRIIDKVLPRLQVLSEDLQFSVRKQLGRCLGKLAVCLGESATEDVLLPIFDVLCEDDIWGVRNACAESIVEIGSVCSDDTRRDILTEVLVRFTKDVSRWVRQAAHQHLGPFISLFEPGEVPQVLVDAFVAMAMTGKLSGDELMANSGDGNGDESSLDFSGPAYDDLDSDYGQWCAFNFPAVVMAVADWPVLEGAYLTLVQDEQWKVRRSLAHGVHEIAALIGPDDTERSLLRVFARLLEEDMDEVKVGVVEHAAEFLGVLTNVSQRDCFVEKVCQIPWNADNWRIRNIVANQIGKLAEISKSVTVTQCLMLLLNDSIHAVRQSAFNQVGRHLKAISAMGDQQERLTNLMDNLREFVVSHDSSYQRRQMYVLFCYSILRDAPDLFMSDFLNTLLGLANDTVDNVVITLAKFYVHARQEIGHRSDVQSIEEKLRRHPHRDVRDVLLASDESAADSTTETETEEASDADYDEEP